MSESVQTRTVWVRTAHILLSYFCLWRSHWSRSALLPDQHECDCPPPSSSLSAVPSHIFGAKDGHCSLHQHENINFSPRSQPQRWCSTSVRSLAVALTRPLLSLNVRVSGGPRQRSSSSTEGTTRVDGLNSTGWKMCKSQTAKRDIFSSVG